VGRLVGWIGRPLLMLFLTGQAISRDREAGDEALQISDFNATAGQVWGCTEAASTLARFTSPTPRQPLSDILRNLYLYSGAEDEVQTSCISAQMYPDLGGGLS
jgi:hypothetical protein